jgi:hypothetical protein
MFIARNYSVRNNAAQSRHINQLLEGMDLLKQKVSEDREWLNLITNIPASEKNKFTRQASFMLAKDAS